MSNSRTTRHNKALTDLFRNTLGFMQLTSNLQQNVHDADHMAGIISFIEKSPQFVDPYQPELPVLGLLRAVNQAWIRIKKAQNDDQVLREWLTLHKVYKEDIYYPDSGNIASYIRAVAPDLKLSQSGRDKLHQILPAPTSHLKNNAVLFSIQAAPAAAVSQREMQLCAELEFYKNRVKELEQELRSYQYQP